MDFDPYLYLLQVDYFYDPSFRDPRREFSISERREVWIRDRGICGLCKRKVNLKKTNGKWHCDHIIPWTMGGPTIVENGQVTHPACNQRKYNDPNYSNIGWNRNWRAWCDFKRNQGNLDLF